MANFYKTTEEGRDNSISVFTIDSKQWKPKFHSTLTDDRYVIPSILSEGHDRVGIFSFGEPSREWHDQHGYETVMIKITKVKPQLIGKLYDCFISSELPFGGQDCSGLVVSQVNGYSVSFWLASNNGFKEGFVQKYITFFKKMCPDCKVI
jgi:hypothetical protein